MRLPSWAPFCAAGFLTTDGEEAKWKRSLLKPFCHQRNIEDFALLESSLRCIMEGFPKSGEAFDLQPYIFDLYLDLSTSVLFGESIGAVTSKQARHAKGFISAFQAGIAGRGLGMAVGLLRHLIPNRSWLISCRKAHQFADYYVDQALEHRRKHLLVEYERGHVEIRMKPRTLLTKMAEVTGDRTLLRDQISQAMMGSQDTTSVLIGNAIHLLSHYPAIQDKLRNEIFALGCKPLTFDLLSHMAYLRAVL